MSSIKLTADSGGGTFELKAPSSGSNARVLTVPDTASGTVLTTTNPKAGNIIQVVSTTKTDHFSHNTSTSTEITGLNVTITPTSSSNKIFLNIAVNFGADENAYAGFNIKRDSTLIAVTTAVDGNDIRRQSSFGGHSGSNNRTFLTGVNFLDSPGDTNAHTYKIFVATLYQTKTISINRAFTTSDNLYNQGMVSTITAMEVAA